MSLRRRRSSPLEATCTAPTFKCRTTQKCATRPPHASRPPSRAALPPASTACHFFDDGGSTSRLLYAKPAAPTQLGENEHDDPHVLFESHVVITTDTDPIDSRARGVGWVAWFALALRERRRAFAIAAIHRAFIGKTGASFLLKASKECLPAPSMTALPVDGLLDVDASLATLSAERAVKYSTQAASVLAEPRYNDKKKSSVR